MEVETCSHAAVKLVEAATPSESSEDGTFSVADWLKIEVVSVATCIAWLKSTARETKIIIYIYIYRERERFVQTVILSCHELIMQHVLRHRHAHGHVGDLGVFPSQYDM